MSFNGRLFLTLNTVRNRACIVLMQFFFPGGVGRVQEKPASVPGWKTGRVLPRASSVKTQIKENRDIFEAFVGKRMDSPAAGQASNMKTSLLKTTWSSQRSSCQQILVSCVRASTNAKFCIYFWSPKQLPLPGPSELPSFCDHCSSIHSCPTCRMFGCQTVKYIIFEERKSSSQAPKCSRQLQTSACKGDEHVLKWSDWSEIRAKSQWTQCWVSFLDRGRRRWV